MPTETVHLAIDGSHFWVKEEGFDSRFIHEAFNKWSRFQLPVHDAEGNRFSLKVNPDAVGFWYVVEETGPRYHNDDLELLSW